MAYRKINLDETLYNPVSKRESRFAVKSPKWIYTRQERNDLKIGTSEVDNSGPFFVVQLVELPKPAPTCIVKVMNQSEWNFELVFVELEVDEDIIFSIHLEKEGIPLLRNSSWEKDISIACPFMNANCDTTLTFIATALIHFIELKVYEVYSLEQSTRIFGGTELVLEKLPLFETSDIIRILCENNFDLPTYDLPEVELLTRLKRSKERFVQSSEIYKPQLTLLSQIEDEHLRQQFSSYSIDYPNIAYDEDSQIYSLSIDQFKQRPSMLKKDTEVEVSVKYGIGSNAFKGVVDRMERNNVIIKMAEIISVDDIVKIEFCADRTTFRLEYRALQLLDEAVIRKLFFPERIEANGFEKFTNFEWFRESVASNAEQRKAIENIVNCTSYPAPYILYGPPGTGKTTTIVEAIYQIHKLKPNSNILVATASNFAANEFVDRLLKVIPSDDIFRFFSKSCERMQNEIDADVLVTSNFHTGTYSNPHYEDIYLSRVVVCTLTTAGRLAQANVSDKYFDYIFIDECGSAKEVSALVAIVGIGAKEKDINALVVLAGDPKQLGPVVKFDYLKDTSQYMSMLERMMNHEFYRRDCCGRYNPLIITQLRDNFRSHEAILHFSNEMFYDNQLRAKAPEEVANWALGYCRLPNRLFPIMFHPINGHMKTDSSSTSFLNEEEANQIIYYIQDMLQKGVKGQHVKQSDIGVLSPYARQVIYLRSLCDEHGWNEIEIGSTEQYQGREKLIMLISTVRSRCPTVGFLANPQRLNVALTRARALLIVVGNPTTLERNYHWKRFIEYCRENDAMVQVRKKKNICPEIIELTVTMYPNHSFKQLQPNQSRFANMIGFFCMSTYVVYIMLIYYIFEWMKVF